MRQLVAALLHLGGRPLEGRGHRRRRELHAGNASRGQDLPLILSELAHALLDHLAKVFRNADLDLLQHRVQPPPSVAYDDEPARDKVLDEAHHEQRIALGSPVDDARELGWKRVAREALPQVVGDLRLAQWLQRELLGAPPRVQLESDVLEGVLAPNYIDRTVGADQEQPRGLLPPSEQRDQIDRRCVTPVQVLEHEHQRRLRGQRFDRLRHLAQHPLARGPQELSLQSVPVRAVEEPRHLREPGGRVLAQEGDQPVAPALAAEAAEGIQHGQMGLRRPVRLDTLAVRDPHARIDGHAREKGPDDPCLADARLTGHEDDLACPAPRRFDSSLEAVERGLAADEVGRAAVSEAAAGGSGPDSRSLGRPVSLWPGLGGGDARDEAISAAVNRRHEARRADSIAEGPPDLAHADLEHGIPRTPPARSGNSSDARRTHPGSETGGGTGRPRDSRRSLTVLATLCAAARDDDAGRIDGVT